MNYYLDTEFDGFGGALLSLALVREDGKSLYLLYAGVPVRDPWVQKNVVPILRDLPYGQTITNCGHFGGAARIAQFLHGDSNPHIHTDWPDDVRYFCQAIITAPGHMVAIPHITFEFHSVDAYPTDLPGAVRHNAWWDAMALRDLLCKSQNKETP